jgi:hypothetical protein
LATEGPLLHDGSQTVAAANYYNPGSALAGPSGSGQFLAVSLSLAAARTALLAATTGMQIYGILQNKPVAGAAADVGIFGITKAMVGSGGSTLGKPQMVNSNGTITDWTSGSSYAQIGYALETGASGIVITIFIGPTSPKVLT